MTAGKPVGGARATSAAAPPADTGEAVGLAARAADGHLRASGPAPVRRSLRARGAATGRLVAAAGVPGRRARRRRARAATCACRRAPTTRRSPSTRCATWPGSAAASSAMRWTQLGFGRTSSTSARSARRATCMGFKDGTNNITPRTPRRWRVTSGSAPASRSWMARRHLHGHAPHPDADRGVGPRDAWPTRRRRSGATSRRARRWARPDEHDPLDLAARDSAGPDDPRRRAHPPRRARDERRRADPAPRLLVHGRDRPRARPARRRAVLHRLPARPAAASSPCRSAWARATR